MYMQVGIANKTNLQLRRKNISTCLKQLARLNCNRLMLVRREFKTPPKASLSIWARHFTLNAQYWLVQWTESNV